MTKIPVLKIDGHGNTLLKKQAKYFEKLNGILQPIWSFYCDDLPSDYLTNDDGISVESDEDSIVSASGPCCEAAERYTEVVVPPPRRSEKLKVLTPTPPPQRYRMLMGEEAPSVNLSDHRD